MTPQDPSLPPRRADAGRPEGTERRLVDPHEARTPISRPDQGVEWLRGEGEASDVVLSSRVRLARNIAGFPFMTRASRADRQQILELAKRRIVGPLAQQLGPELGSQIMWVDLHEASRLERTLLTERHLISKQHARGKLADGSGGADEPRGVAVGLPGERLAIMVNEEDHLRIQLIRAGLALSDCVAEIDVVDDRLEQGLDFAFSPRFGYLTACPTNVGTGIRLSVMLHLPALKLTGDLEKVKRAADDMSLAVRGFYGEGSDAAGDLYQLSNQTTLGKSEQVLLHEMESEIIPRVVDYERHARSEILEKRRVATEDQVHRALGVLRHARMITAEESMELLSQVRLGIALGFFDGPEGRPQLEPRTVNKLLLLIQPAHLQKHIGRELNQQERRAERARLLREMLA